MFSPHRNISLSVDLRLHQALLQLGFCTTYTQKALVPVAASARRYGWTTNWTYGLADPKHGWVIIDDAAQAITNTVQVYVGGVEQSPSTYAVDFKNGWVIFPSAPAGAVAATFRQWDILIREGYPDRTLLETAQLPIAAYTVAQERGRPYAIGTAAEFLTYEIEIDLLAKSAGDLKDATSLLRKLMAYLPMYDFTDAMPLGYGNAINPRFNAGAQTLCLAAVVRKPRGLILDPKAGGHEKERHRSQILLTAEITG